MYGTDPGISPSQPLFQFTSPPLSGTEYVTDPNPPGVSYREFILVRWEYILLISDTSTIGISYFPILLEGTDFVDPSRVPSLSRHQLELPVHPGHWSVPSIPDSSLCQSRLHPSTLRRPYKSFTCYKTNRFWTPKTFPCHSFFRPF